MAEASLEKYHPGASEDFVLLFAARETLLERTKAPLDARIDNSKKLVAATGRTGRIEEALEQQLDLAQMLLEAHRMPETEAVLQAGFRDAHHVDPKDYDARLSATNIVCELMWTELEIGQPQAALAIAADPLVHSSLVDREADWNPNTDPFEGNEEQARAYALVATGQAAAAVPIFASFVDRGIKQYGDDSGGLIGPPLLDLLVAQTKAGLPADGTRSHLRKLFAGDTTVDAAALRDKLQNDVKTPGIFSTYRAQAELGALSSL